MLFVVHHHFSKKEHFDLRLEMDNVLKSWAVPKEIPLEKGIKRLAIQVDDHDLEYANFEGIIPEGFYGAGKVEIWDKGEYKLISRDENKIEFETFGNKMRGIYVLLKFGAKNKNTWLLFKK